LKKTIAISFLLILCVSQLGYYFIYHFQQIQVKREIKTKIFAALSESAFEIFIAEENIDAIKWEEDGKEFSLHGELYDVAKIKKINGKTLLYCVNDKKEKELLNNFIKAIKASTNNGKSGKHTLKFQLTDYTIIPIEKNAEVRLLCNQKFICYNSSLHTAITEINTPPPKA
jgi:hypothetical protein